MRRSVLMIIGLMLLSACGNSTDVPQSQEARFGDARTSYTYTTGVADAIVSHARELYPDLVFDLNYDASRDDMWHECNAEVPGNSDIPEWVSWESDRVLSIDPAQLGENMVMPILEEFIDDGWVLSGEMMNGTAWLSKDGFGLHVTGTGADSLAAGRRTGISIFVTSPCLESPDDLADFDPDDPDAYFGSGSAPTVGPFTPPATSQAGEL